MIKSYEKLRKQNKDKFNVPKSAQDIIDAETIYKDGIFQSGNRFSKTYRFQDINYAIASKEEKEGIFLDYSDLLNSLDSSSMTKITINNHKVNIKEFKEDILIPLKHDELDKYREEYNEMLLEKVTGADDIQQEKYITVSIFKNNISDARNFFSRATLELSTHFSKLGSHCEEMDTIDRLKVLHDFFRSDEEEFFYFNMKEFSKKGHDFKDAICPHTPSFEHRHFKIGDKYGCVLYLSNYANYVSDEFVSELCKLNKHMMYSMDIITIPTDEAVREVENRLLGVETNISATRS